MCPESGLGEGGWLRHACGQVDYGRTELVLGRIPAGVVRKEVAERNEGDARGTGISGVQIHPGYGRVKSLLYVHAPLKRRRANAHETQIRPMGETVFFEVRESSGDHGHISPGNRPPEAGCALISLRF